MDLTRRTFLQSLAAAAVVSPALARAQSDAPKAVMLQRTIASSRESIPAIGMGTWQTFDAMPTDADAMKRLSEVLQAFHDAGGRVIDSSPMYGRSEEVVGTLSTNLKLNADLFIATKVWTRGEEAGVKQMDESVEKLGRRNIELMQIHNLLDWQIHLKTLRRWKEAGRIKLIGITHYQPTMLDDLERILKAEAIDFVQLPYSVDFREAEKSLIPTARDRGTAILVMRPFGGGDLFAKVRGKPLPDHAKAYCESWAQAFLKFILANEAITAVLPATSKPHHMRDNVQAGFDRLPDEKERRLLIDAVTSS